MNINKTYKVEVTDWFPGDVNPVRTGVYEQGTRQYLDEKTIMGNLYSYWNGFHWSSIEGSVEEAYKYRKHRGTFQHEPWRGLTSRSGL